ncbi:MAG: ATP-dependent protease ATPase subunit HslU [Salinispira sp.]
MKKLEDLTPSQIVAELDKYIIGQQKAKKAVAIALRNRIRRQKLPEDLIDEVAPKNIIMIGPTGVGKTEIARRLSRLTGAPFLKIEATKYTEVGYVGRDVESMVRDLMMVAVNMVKDEFQEDIREEAAHRVEDQLLDLLLPGSRPPSRNEELFAATEKSFDTNMLPLEHVEDEEVPNATREKFRQKLKDGHFEEKEVEIAIQRGGFRPSIEIFSGQNLEEIDLNLGNLGNLFGGGRKKKKKTTVKNARELLLQEEIDKMVDPDQVSEIARKRVEELGIIFIDEIDKISVKNGIGTDVSREGVQRDILPIVEGSKVNTKFGVIDTSHILFIAAGAFHMSKPSDLIPELQGRFPIRVELEALSEDDFYKILTQPQNALTLQYTALMKTEDVHLDFKDDALKELSSLAADVNSRTENIGARRLHTLMELLLEDLSYNASEMGGQIVPITKEYVQERLQDIVRDQDLSRYIL